MLNEVKHPAVRYHEAGPLSNARPDASLSLSMTTRRWRELPFSYQSAVIREVALGINFPQIAQIVAQISQNFLLMLSHETHE
jgi:hypothetical protein